MNIYFNDIELKNVGKMILDFSYRATKTLFDIGEVVIPLILGLIILYHRLFQINVIISILSIIYLIFLVIVRYKRIDVINIHNYNDLLNKGLDDAKVLKDDLTREAIISLINKDKSKTKISDDKKSLVGLKELIDGYRKQAPHFFEKKASGYSPVNPEGDKGDGDGEISMGSNFAKQANESDNPNTKSQFFN